MTNLFLHPIGEYDYLITQHLIFNDPYYDLIITYQQHQSYLNKIIIHSGSMKDMKFIKEEYTPYNIPDKYKTVVDSVIAEHNKYYKL